MDAKVKALVALLPWLKGKEIAIRPLDGGLTNRNYQLDSGDEQFVLRVMGRNSSLLGIDRQVEHACSHAAFVAGVGSEVMAFFPRRKVIVSRFIHGQVLDVAALKNPDTLQRVVSAIRRYHECGNTAGRFSVFETVRNYHAEASKRGVDFPRGIVRAMRAFARIEKELGPVDKLHSCHNDLLAANLVDDGRAIRILDWEYAGVGDLFFDLGNLAANNLFTRQQETRLLQYYFGQARAVDLRRLRFMRLASDMREAIWGFLQRGISELDFDYQEYAHHHLRRFLKAVEGYGWK